MPSFSCQWVDFVLIVVCCIKGLALVKHAILYYAVGTYQQFQNRGLTVDQNGNLSYWRCVIAGATSGCIGSLAASPAYMVSICYRN